MFYTMFSPGRKCDLKVGYDITIKSKPAKLWKTETGGVAVIQKLCVREKLVKKGSDWFVYLRIEI